MPSTAARRFATALSAERASLTDVLVGEAVSRLPEYEALSDDGYDPTLVENVRHHLEVFNDVLISGTLHESSTVFAHKSAAARARQGLSLASILQSYQVVTRGLWRWATTHPTLKDDAAAIAAGWPLWLEYTDRATRAAADAYLVVSRERVQADSDARRTFLDMLLSGRLTGPEWTRWLASFGFHETPTPFVLVVLHWWDDNEYRIVDAAARTSRAIATRLRAASGTTPIDAVRDKEVVILVDATRMTPARIHEEVSRSIATMSGRGLSMSGAISNPATSPDGVVDAYAQARRAAVATRSSGTVRRVDEIGLFDHAAAALRTDVRKVCAPRLADFVSTALANPHDIWIPTVLAWANSNMNAGQAAQDLHVHRNTVYYRLRQVADAAGTDPQTVEGLAELLIAFKLSDEFHD